MPNMKNYQFLTVRNFETWEEVLTLLQQKLPWSLVALNMEATKNKFLTQMRLQKSGVALYREITKYGRRSNYEK